MAKFKIIVSDPGEAKSSIVELDGARAVPLIGRRLGETIEGTSIGSAGKKLLITGGSDKDGFPMRPDVHGGVRISILVGGGVGFHPKREGERRRKTIRGNVITEEIVQINMKVVEQPKSVEKLTKAKKVGSETETAKEKTLEGGTEAKKASEESAEAVNIASD
jgi:small subunit ribosomal protein S6e